MFIYWVILLQVWNAPKFSADEPEQPYNEIDLLAGHENDVNYVQFRSVCCCSSWTYFTFKESNSEGILLLIAVAVPLLQDQSLAML